MKTSGRWLSAPALIITQIVGFLLLLWFLNRFVFKPIFAILDERQKDDPGRPTTRLDADRKRMEDTRRQYEERLANIEAEARERIQAAVKEAQALRDNLIADAHQNAESITVSARNEAERERQKAFLEMRQQVVALAVAAAGKVVGESLDDAAPHQAGGRLHLRSRHGPGHGRRRAHVRRQRHRPRRGGLEGNGMKDTRVARRYAAALFGIAVRDNILDAVAEDLTLISRFVAEVPYLRAVLMQPLVSDERKNKVATDAFGDRVTATSLNFLKLLIRKRREDLIDECVRQFRVLLAERNNTVEAIVYSAVPLAARADRAADAGPGDDDREDGPSDAGSGRQASSAASSSASATPSLTAACGAACAAWNSSCWGRSPSEEWDNVAIRPEEITSVLERELDAFKTEVEEVGVGTILQIGDGIARIYGLQDAMVGELLEFPGGVQGMALNLEEDNVGAVLLGDETGIKEGDTVKRTGKIIQIPVGEALVGRIVNALGQPVDDKGPIASTEFRLLEGRAPGVVERQPVKEPLQTGIKAIDSMIPIGRGQRELIIGDRQTGKTAIALDTIINQKNTDVYCIYVAIGQKASTVANVIRTLEQARRDGVHHGGRGDGQRPGLAAVHLPLHRRLHRRVVPGQRQARPGRSSTTFPSRPSPTARFRCCCAARRAARRTPATCSTCTPACWSAPPSCPTNWAAAR